MECKGRGFVIQRVCTDRLGKDALRIWELWLRECDNKVLPAKGGAFDQANAYYVGSRHLSRLRAVWEAKQVPTKPKEG